MGAITIDRRYGRYGRYGRDGRDGRDAVGVNDIVNADAGCYVRSLRSVTSTVTVSRFAADLVLRDDLVLVLGSPGAVAAFLVAIGLQSALLQARLETVNRICETSSLTAHRAESRGYPFTRINDNEDLRRQLTMNN